MGMCAVCLRLLAVILMLIGEWSGGLGLAAEAALHGDFAAPAQLGALPDPVREIIAPYGKGTAAAVVRWLQRSVPDRVSRVRYLRIDPGHQRRRIVEITRHGSGFGARAVPAAHILNDD